MMTPYSPVDLREHRRPRCEDRRRGAADDADRNRALVIPDIVPFWAAVLGYETLGEGPTLIDPDYEGPTVWFQQMTRHDPSATAFTSTSTCRAIKRRRASRLR